MKNKKKLIIGIVIAAVVIIAAVVLFLVLGKKNNSTKIYIQSVKDVMGESTVANRFSGVIETQKSEKIEFDASQQLEEVYVTEGQRVKSGDRLFSYNADTLRLEIEELSIEIEKYSATIENSQNEIAELRSIIDQYGPDERLTINAQIQQLEADIAQAQYDAKTKQSTIASKQSSIEKATVCSSMNGTVQTINDINAIINGDNSSAPDANVYMVIVADGNFRVKGSVGEQNIQDIYAGEKVIVRSRVDHEKTWNGEIASINTQNTENSQDNYYGYGGGESSSKYSFYVNLESTDGLMLGQHVTIEPDYGQAQKREGVWLNSSYIVRSEDGENAYVWAAKKDGASLEKRKITVGKYDEELDMFEISSGLTKDEYVAWPSSDCKEGAATSTVAQEDYFDEVPAADDIENYGIDSEMPFEG